MKFSLNNIYNFVKKNVQPYIWKSFWTSVDKFWKWPRSNFTRAPKKGGWPDWVDTSKTAWCNKKAWFAQNLKIPFETGVSPLYLFEITTDSSEISITIGEKRQKSSKKCPIRSHFERWIQRSTFSSRLGRRETSRRPTIAPYRFEIVRSRNCFNFCIPCVKKRM